MLSTYSAQKKSEPCKWKSVYSDLGILYPAPKIPNPNLNFKLCWCKILLLEPRNFTFFCQLVSSLGLDIPRYSSRDSFLLFLVKVYYASTVVGDYMNGEMVKRIFSRWGFTMLLLSWGNTFCLFTCFYCSVIETYLFVHWV